MKTHTDFEWTFCGERYRIRFFPLVARFEVCIEGEWVRLAIAHRPSPNASFDTKGLPGVLRRHLLAALGLDRAALADGRPKTPPRRGATKEVA